jgi:hypothetical protein
MSGLNEFRELVLESERKVPELKVSPSLFIDRTIAIYGPSKTGKTVIIKHIMKTVDTFIEQVLIIAPSEPSNRAYEGFVESPFIHYRLYLADPKNPKKDDGAKGALRFLEAVWKRQEMMAAIYTRANSIAILLDLFNKLPKDTRKDAMKHIDVINKKKNNMVEKIKKQYMNEQGRRDEKIKEINEKFKKMLTLLYKKYITPHYDELYRQKHLTEDEKYSLYYLNFNPRLLLIFDDCAAQLKPFFNKEIFRMLFYQNRHSFITVIISCQDDTDLPTNLRKNSFISFFTEPIVCTSNFERSSNQFSKPTRAFISEMVPALFKGHRKLAYIREDDTQQQFYHVQFPFPKKFRFGSNALAELCDSVKCDGITMDKDNPFYNRFKI